jgi:hypothetical protein
MGPGAEVNAFPVYPSNETAVSENAYAPENSRTESPTEAVPSPSRFHAATGKRFPDGFGEAEATEAVGTSGVNSLWVAQAASTTDVTTRIGIRL